MKRAAGSAEHSQRLQPGDYRTDWTQCWPHYSRTQMPWLGACVSELGCLCAGTQRQNTMASVELGRAQVEWRNRIVCALPLAH